MLHSSETAENDRREAVLIEPAAKFKTDFLAMAEEFRAAGEARYDSALDDFSDYLEEAAKYARGINLKPDRVPEDEYWLFCRNMIIGRVRLRRRLTPELEKEGGHIGYDIRPSERRKGYGTTILKLMLEKAADSGFKRILITCDTDNLGSAKIIEKNGGRLAGHAISDISGKQISRYWIEL